MENKNNKNSTNKQPAKSYTQPEQADQNNICFWIAVGLFATGLIMFIISIIVTVLGFYGIVASMILELAAVSFLNGQKKHGYFTLCKVLRVLSYIVMIAGFVVILGGIIVINK